MGKITPFDMSFEALKEYYNTVNKWGTREDWKSIIQELNICDDNNDYKYYQKPPFYFPLKSSDLVFYLFEAYRSKREKLVKKEFSNPPVSGQEYKGFVNGFFEALTKVKPQQYTNNLLFSDSVIQYLTINQSFLGPFIEKIALLLTIILLNNTEKRISLISYILNDLDEIIADYLIENPSFTLDPSLLTEVVQLDKRLINLCNTLKRDENEFDSIYDHKTSDTIKMYEEALKRESEDKYFLENKAKEEYLEYLNTTLCSGEQDSKAKIFQKKLANIEEAMDKGKYKQCLSDLLCSMRCSEYNELLIEPIIIHDLNNFNAIQFVLKSNQQQFTELFHEFLKGSDTYQRHFFKETAIQFNSCIKQVVTNYYDYLFEFSMKINQKIFYHYDILDEDINSIKRVINNRCNAVNSQHIRYFWEIPSQYKLEKFIKDFESIMPKSFYYILNKFVSHLETIFPKANTFVNALYLSSDKKVYANIDYWVSFLQVLWLDNLMIVKQIADNIAEEFLERKMYIEKDISEKIKEIKNSNATYVELAKGFDNAVYDFLYNIYKE